MKWARRFRGLTAAALLVFSPAGAGQLAPLLHPCPVDAPWLARAKSESHHHHETSHASVPGHGSCHCIGACSAPAVVAPIEPAALAAAPIEIPPSPSRHRLVHPVSGGLLARLLPPKTAPPRA